MCRNKNFHISGSCTDAATDYFSNGRSMPFLTALCEENEAIWIV